ncbi:MAG: hypothetical protein IPN34_03340 [Planctomycetes bacterium]|nr:hypothetical protein [Planctomycetota bacterium]
MLETEEQRLSALAAATASAAPAMPRTQASAHEGPAAPSGGSGDAPRRDGPDRRKRPTPMFSRYTFFGGRRHAIRREGEREGAFVDLYGPGILMLVLLVVGLNIFDSFFTLVYLQRGGLEANPIVQLLLDQGMGTFVLVKNLVIGFALCMLCVCKNFSYARLGLQIAIWVYSLLAVYHIFLYSLDMF